MRKLFIFISIILIILLIAGCVSYKKYYRIEIPENNLSLDFENDPVEIRAHDYLITIHPYAEDVRRGEAVIN